jgi:Na+/H+ antiporter NhaC
MIGRVCQDIGTADYLIALSVGVVSPVLLPVLLFALACLVSFATGTSWGTMSILLPNVVGLAAALGAGHPLGSTGLVLISIGAVLEGSIFGDHCSPISDTTVLSSVATASDHVDHVRTQVPYALLAAAAAVGFGYLPSLLVPGFPLAVSLVLGCFFWWAVLRLFGRAPGE